MMFSSSNVFIPILVMKLLIAGFYRGCDANAVALPGPNLPDAKYLISTQEVTWAEAFVLCQQNGMELASITSQEEEDAIEALLNNYVTTPGYLQGYYTAANRNGACVTPFIWFTNGKPVLYTDWGAGQPDNAGGIENCIEIFLISKGNYAWNDLPCTIKTGYICQARPDPCCHGCCGHSCCD